MLAVCCRFSAVLVRGGGVDAVLCIVPGAGVVNCASLVVAGVFVVILGPGPWRWSSLIRTSGVMACILFPGRPRVDMVGVNLGEWGGVYLVGEVFLVP
jgi:hypothetical protein